MRKPIYLDYMATTPVDERVIEKMISCLGIQGTFGNSASVTHCYGYEAKEKIDVARQHIADLIGADAREIVFTSGATEANNLALKGASHFYERKGKHIITTKIEHKSVLDVAHYLEENKFEVTYLMPDENGIIHYEQVKKAIRPDTILLSVMHANNEIGVIQDIAALGTLARQEGIIFHVDAAQSIGKIPFNVETIQADLVSFSGHKLYGPKGIGALYVRRKPRVRLHPLLHGGGHEFGLRSGTLPTHQIVGLGEACRIANEEMLAEMKRITGLRDKLWAGIYKLGYVYLNGDTQRRLPGNLNVSFEFVEGESLLVALSELAISSGAACNSATLEPSYVLKAIGRSNELANSSLRFCIGRFTSEKDINEAISHIEKVVTRLREISPLGVS